MEKLSAIERWTMILAQIPRQYQQALAERVNFSDPPELYAFCMDEAMRSNTRETKRLVDTGFFEKAILTEGALLTEEACSLFQALNAVIENFDLKILTAVTNSQRVWPEEVSEWEMNRVLNIFRGSSPNIERLNILLQRFARAPHPSVRSRAVKLIGEAFRQESWFEKMMKDFDPRVRSNVLEVVSELKELNPFFKGLVAKAAEDRHHRVQTTALFVLAKFGDGVAATRIVELLNHRSEHFRKAARWAMRALAAAKLKAKSAEGIVIPSAAESRSDQLFQSESAVPAAAGEPPPAAVAEPEPVTAV